MRRALLSLLLVVGACASGDAPEFSSRTVPTASTTTTSVTTTSTVAPPPGSVTPAVPFVCPATSRVGPDPNRPRYVVNFDVRPAERVVVGDVTVRFTPDLPTDRLVFRIWANSPRILRSGGGESVTPPTGERFGDAVVDGTMLTVPLRRPLDRGDTIEATVGWRLTLPGESFDRISQTGDTIRLGSFFPTLAWEPGVGWAIDPPVDAFAEASTATTADFEMNVTVPDGLEVIASGIPDAAGRRWRAEAVRDVALSVGRFRRAERVVENVRITVGVATNLPDAPETYLNKLADRLRKFNVWYGPYPYATYTLAITPSLGGGIEYPMHVMQGSGTHGRTTTHELAHMWFYGLVGNNQGRDPWLDEGLASYAEARGENALGQMLATPMPADARGRVGEPMTYWSAHRSSYYAGVYIQGAQAVASLGPVDRVDCALRIYAADNAYRVARPADLVKAMAAIFGDTTKLARFGVTSNP